MRGGKSEQPDWLLNLLSQDPAKPEMALLLSRRTIYDLHMGTLDAAKFPGPYPCGEKAVEILNSVFVAVWPFTLLPGMGSTISTAMKSIAKSAGEKRGTFLFLVKPFFSFFFEHVCLFFQVARASSI